METTERNKELLFLQDQVTRLSSVLKSYQTKCPPISDVKDEVWIYDSSMLSPLLMEYDQLIKSLKEDIEYYKIELHKLQKQAQDVVQENMKLHAELRSKVELHAGSLEDNSLSLLQLEIKLKTAFEEKNIISKQLDNANKELMKIKEENRIKGNDIANLLSENVMLKDDIAQARAFASDLQNANLRFKAEQEKVLNTIEIYDSQIESLKSQNRKLLCENKTLKALNSELQIHAEQQKEHLKHSVKSQQYNLSERSAEGTIRKLQNEILGLESRVVLYSKELDKLRYENSDLEEKLATLQKKINMHEENEQEAVMRVRDSVQLVENALIEKEKAVVSEQQKVQEIIRLQEALKSLISHAEEEKRKEVSRIKAQNDKEIRHLMEDLHYQENECAEKQALLEKSYREKLALENEIEKIYQEGPIEITKAGQTLDELHVRLARAEMARDDAYLQNENLQANFKRLQTRWENEKNVLTKSVNDSNKKLACMKNDLDEMANSRLLLLEELNTLKKKVLVNRENDVSQELSNAAKVALLEQKIEMKEKNFQSLLRASEESGREAANELRDMLRVQQKSASKWREESRALCQKYELQVAHLRQVNDDLTRRNQDLERMYNESLQKASELEKSFYLQQLTIDKMQRLHSTCEERIETSNNQVSSYLVREKQLVDSQKALTREIERLRLDSIQSCRNQTQPIDLQWDNYISEINKEMT
ncbi:sodium channel and clathrin linker 1 isoform X1 [Hydra vulgaris]